MENRQRAFVQRRNFSSESRLEPIESIEDVVIPFVDDTPETRAKARPVVCASLTHVC